ncbi:MAG TPA: TIGR00730 family Rossman fold protein [Vicinamibacteria bacterium]
MRRVCVFCGSAAGRDPAFAEAARGLARGFARRGTGIVYGGGSVGLMGVLADEALGAGVEVIGVIPHGLLVREVAHRGLTEQRVVPTMHARKALMAELADAFVALPGGLGTLEELFEVVTWAQLGIHAKPIGLLNTRGYFDALLAFVERAIAAGFVRPEYRGFLVVADHPDALFHALERHRPPAVAGWATPADT